MDAVKKMTMIALAAGAIATQGSAFAADGTINFSGKVIDSGCTVAETANGPLSVALGSFAKTSFKDVGAQSAKKGFTLTLTNCPGTAASVQIRFAGNPDPTNSTLIALTPGTAADPSATGIALGLSDTTGAPLPNLQNSSAVTLVNNAATLNLIAFYQRTGTVVSGAANAVADFTLIYP